jgi:hypothetical protein
MKCKGGWFSIGRWPASLEEHDVYTNESESAGADSDNTDWRVALRECIIGSGATMDSKIWRQALKYTMIDKELYWRTVDDILLKCLSTEKAKVTMGEVHEGLCDTHQSTHKMRWMLKRAGFYWPSMVEDCFNYLKGNNYLKGCEVCGFETYKWHQ